MRILSRHSLQQQQQQQPPPSSSSSLRSADSSSPRLKFGASVGSGAGKRPPPSLHPVSDLSPPCLRCLYSVSVVAVIGRRGSPITWLRVGRVWGGAGGGGGTRSDSETKSPSLRSSLPVGAAPCGRATVLHGPHVCRSSPRPASSH